MKQITSIGKLACAAALTLGLGAVAHAGALRTFVSAQGNDSNTSTNCAATTPCRTLQAAFSVTTVPGGEIDAQNAAGYGAITTTITGTLSILGVPGAAISVPSSGTGITINSGSGTVIIEGFQFTGNGASNTTGITINGGNLILENSALKLLETGLKVNSAHATLVNVDVVSNSVGITTTGTGLQPDDGINSGTTEVLLDRGTAINNTTAYFMNSPGLDADDDANTTFLVFSIGSYTTAISGNGTVITGTGTGCSPSCAGLGTYEQSNNPH